MTQLGANFYKKLLEVSRNVGMKPEDILNVMAIESGLNPSAHNKAGNASGLTQFMPKTLKGLGFKGTHEDFRKTSAEDQLEYVEKMIRSLMGINGGPLRSGAQYYVGNFIPVALKLPGVQSGDPNTIIVSKEPQEPHLPGVDVAREKLFYKVNAGLDFDKDGEITYGDIQNVLRRAASTKNFQNAIADLQSYTNYIPGALKEVNPKKKNNITDQYITRLNREIPNIDNILNNYLQMVAASGKDQKKLYKQHLPNQHMTINIFANHYVDAIEFARILGSVIEEELHARAYTHTDGHVVELECSILGREEECFLAAKEITLATMEAFKDATKKIGSLEIKTECIMNKQSFLKQIEINAADRCYRQFLLKFI